MSLNQSASIALGSLKNNQYALTVVAQNIANMNTEGYYRKGVQTNELAYNQGSKSVTTRIRGLAGATISDMTDYADAAAFRSVVNSNADASYYNNLADALGDLGNVSNELGENGLISTLNDFYAAVANLEQFPTDYTMRQQFVLALENVADKFNSIESQYDTIQQDKFDNIEIEANSVNTIISNIATLNEAYAKTGSTSVLSEINSNLKELSGYVNITYDQNTNGTFNVYIDNTAVVKGTEAKYNLAVSFDTNAVNPTTTTDSSGNTVIVPATNQVATFNLVSTSDPTKVIDITDKISSGSFKAEVDFLNGKGGSIANINDMKAAIQSAGDAFMNALNAIQTYPGNNDPTETVFAAYITTNSSGDLVLSRTNTSLTLLDRDASGNLVVNSAISSDPFKICAARIDLANYSPTDDWTLSVGNSDNAAIMSDLQNQKICSYNGGTNNATLSQFLTNLAAKAGMDASSIENKADIYQSIADTDAQAFSDMVGVNIDEELANMIMYQRAYEASARLFTVIDSMMQTIIGMV